MRAAVYLATLLCASGCSRPTLEDVTRDQLDLMEDFTELISSIETEEDAREAVDEIEKCTVRAKRLKERYHRVNIPKKEELEALQKQFGERSMAVYGKVFAPETQTDWSPEVKEILAGPAWEFVDTMFEERK